MGFGKLNRDGIVPVIRTVQDRRTVFGLTSPQACQFPIPSAVHMHLLTEYSRPSKIASYQSSTIYDTRAGDVGTASPWVLICNLWRPLAASTAREYNAL